MRRDDERCTCEDQESTETHSCPYAAEIGGDDSEDHCACCSFCEGECAMDI